MLIKVKWKTNKKEFIIWRELQQAAAQSVAAIH